LTIVCKISMGEAAIPMFTIGDSSLSKPSIYQTYLIEVRKA
jgi:hypothetical protein